jgi:AcrR family transcriptional regulator
MTGRKQFDVDVALDQAMRVFWARGYAQSSLELLSSATGLGRGSLYGTFGGKDALFRRCLDRYAAIYGDRYERALAACPDEPVRAVEGFFDVVLDRIADPAVPDGCLVAQSVSESSTLDPGSRAHAYAVLETQRDRVRAALSTPGVDARQLDDLAIFVVAVNQSLAVLSRAGRPAAELRSVVRTACATVADTLAGARRESGS